MSDLFATRRTLLLGTALAAGQVAVAKSQTTPPGFAAMTANANIGTVGIISGGVDGTYVRIAADLASVLDDERLRVLPIIGKGSVQNLADIVFLRGVDLGVVQSDALAFVLAEKQLPGIEHMINYIAKLYDEEVHVIARPEIGSLADLAGKPVNVDVRGSGTAMTAQLIFKSVKVSIQAKDDTQDLALQKLRAGEIAAMVYVTGKPARLFGTIPTESGLHFLAIPPLAELVDTYLPAQLDHTAYPGLVPSETPVPTVAVGALMAVYAWPPGTERRARVDRFVEALTAKLPLLQQAPRHPKWREVNLAAQAPGWTRLDTVAPDESASSVSSRLRHRSARLSLLEIKG